MSRILNRPMFRGGGKVSSYGKGIAAPLVPGYQKGGQIGGGIIYGKPMSDGRYGFQKPILKDFVPQINLGKSVSDLANKKVSAMSPVISQYELEPKKINTETESAEETAGKIDGIDVVEKTSFEKMMENDQYGNQDPYKEIEEVTIEDKIKSYTPDGLPDVIKKIIEKESTFTDEKGIVRSTTTGKEIIPESELQKINKNMKSFPRDAEDMGVAETDSTIPKLDLGDNDNGDNNTEDLQISAKDAIRQNQELFKDLLGDKKARGQDISDMLLRFSGSQGDTLGEKFQNYTRAEAAAGPGRSEKISQTAAGLAINDYVAGKRSKEQIEALKGKIDYEYGKKAEAVNVQPGDSSQTALFKIAKKADVKPNSDAAYKYLIGMKTGSDKVFRIDKVKMKDLEKPKAQKKLKIGFNIIEEDGRKNIVQWDGTNYNILSISEIWKG